MIGLWPLAPYHETDVVASPSTAQCRGAGGMKIDAAQPDAMNAIRPWALRPPLDRPGQTCGTVGPQQLEDCSLEHSAAGRAATQSA